MNEVVKQNESVRKALVEKQEAEAAKATTVQTSSSQGQGGSGGTVAGEAMSIFEKSMTEKVDQLIGFASSLVETLKTGLLANVAGTSTSQTPDKA